jgi:hypothetical protein
MGLSGRLWAVVGQARLQPFGEPDGKRNALAI